jgi:hypothetical protein
MSPIDFTTRFPLYGEISDETDLPISSDNGNDGGMQFKCKLYENSSGEQWITILKSLMTVQKC